jgi:hypothetical protein
MQLPCLVVFSGVPEFMLKRVEKYTGLPGLERLAKEIIYERRHVFQNVEQMFHVHGREWNALFIGMLPVSQAGSQWRSAPYCPGRAARYKLGQEEQ